MKLVIEKTGYTVAPEVTKTTLVVAPFDTGANSIQKSIFDAKGQLPVSSAASEVDNLVVGNDGEVLIADSGETLGVRWGTPSTGVGYTELTNKSGGAVVPGDVVIWDGDNDTAFKTTTVATNSRVAGVVVESIGNNSTGSVATYGGMLVSVNCDTGAVGRGEWLVSSATEKKAMGAGYYKPTSAFAMALTAKAAGSTGTVQAILVNEWSLGTGSKAANYGYFMGGITSASVATTDQIQFSTESIVGKTTANVSTARWSGGPVSDCVTYGYVSGGYSSAHCAIADQLTFATYAAAAKTSANLSSNRSELAGVSDGTSYGYFLGGNTTTATPVALTDQITYGTQATAAKTGANLSGIRYQVTGLSDRTTYGYVSGGTSNGTALAATTDQITFSTQALAAKTAANLSQARRSAGSVSDNVTYGYVAGGTTGAVVATADMTTFSTQATAARTAANLSQARYTLYGTSDGIMYGYLSGGYTGAAVATTDRITFSTQTLAARTTANLTTARYGSAGLSDGAV